MTDRALTPKEELFCQKVIELGDDTAAYRASYNAAGMKPNTQKCEAHKLKRKPHIAARISALRAEYAKSIGVTIERILQEKMRLATVDIRKLCYPDGTPKNIHELDDDTAAAVASFEIVTKVVEPKKKGGKLGITRTARVKMYDKGHALTDLMRHLGLFEKDNKQKADALSQLLISMGAMNDPQD
jgi:phage terminase small subunit